MVNPPSTPAVSRISVDDLLPIVEALGRRGFTTSEWLTPFIGAVLALVFAKIGVPGPQAVQIIAVLSPVVGASVYTVMRSLFKVKLANTLKLPGR